MKKINQANKNKLGVKNLKIILVNSLAAGGAEKVVTILVNELYKKGHKILLICLEKKIDYKIPPGINVKFLSEDTGDSSGFIKLLKLIILAWRLKKILINQKASVVQSHLYRANYVNILAKFLGSPHSAQLVNGGTISWYKTKGILGRVNLFLIKYLYAKADVLILKNQLMLNDMQEMYSFKTKKHIIHNPYDIKLIEDKANEGLNNFNFNPNMKYIISVGRLIPLKNYDYLIKAFKIVKNKLNNIELILVGDGPEKKKLINLAIELKINEYVHFTGHVENPFKYISKSQLFVLPSSTEGFPNVLVEAMICKVPVVSTDCLGGTREILAPDSDINFQLKDGIEYAEYGVMLPINDTLMLSNAIIALFENKELRNKYAQNAYKRAREFSIKRIIPEYENILNEATIL